MRVFVLTKRTLVLAAVAIICIILAVVLAVVLSKGEEETQSTAAGTVEEYELTVLGEFARSTLRW